MKAVVPSACVVMVKVDYLVLVFSEVVGDDLEPRVPALGCFHYCFFSFSGSGGKRGQSQCQ